MNAPTERYYEYKLYCGEVNLENTSDYFEFLVAKHFPRATVAYATGIWEHTFERSAVVTLVSKKYVDYEPFVREFCKQFKQRSVLVTRGEVYVYEGSAR